MIAKAVIRLGRYRSIKNSLTVKHSFGGQVLKKKGGVW